MVFFHDGRKRWGQWSSLSRWMVRAPPSCRCSKEQQAVYTPHLHNLAGCGPSFYDFLTSCWNHLALDHGAGVVAPPPSPRHKPSTHHTKSPCARRIHRSDVQRSHSRSLLVCCLGSLDSHSMTAGGGAALPKVIISLQGTWPQAEDGAGGGAAAVFRRSRAHVGLPFSIFQRLAVPHRTPAGGDGY